jgi:hypothetical protein
VSNGIFLGRYCLISPLVCSLSPAPMTGTGERSRRLSQQLATAPYAPRILCRCPASECSASPGYRLEGTDGGPVRRYRPLVRHYFRREQFCFPVNKDGYIGLFTGAFYGVPLPITRAPLLFNDFRAFINGNTVRYLAPAVLCPLPLPRFPLSLPEMLFQRRVSCRFAVETVEMVDVEACFSGCSG